jgi:hypothetical protein
MRHTLAIVGAALVAVFAAVAIPAMAASFHSGHYTMSAGSSLDVSCPNALSYATTDVNDGTLSCADNPVTTTTIPPTTTTTSAACTAGFSQPCMAVPPGYSSSQMVLDEKFGGPGLDSNWSDITGGPAPWVGSWHTSLCCNQPTVSNGLTVDNTKSTNADTANPSTGQTLFHFPQAFYLQVRFKVSTTANGFFPAIWFPFDNYNCCGSPPSPREGNEIDFFEGGMLGGACNTVDINSCVEFNYGGNSADDPQWQQGFYNVGYDITQNFVTVGAEIVPGQHAKIWYNGHLVLDDENGANIGAQPDYNLQITPQGTPGGSWHTQGPGTGSMEIAEVQVYS